MPDQLSAHYQDLLAGSYDCVDRIVLNAYFRLGMNPGGFRYWWRQLTGSEEQLDNEHWMRMAGRFSRRVRASAKAHQIPVIDCGAGERKHAIAAGSGGSQHSRSCSLAALRGRCGSDGCRQRRFPKQHHRSSHGQPSPSSPAWASGRNRRDHPHGHRKARSRRAS